MATAISAQIRLGMVRMQFIAIRAITTSQRGDKVCAPAAASGNAKTTEKNVAMTAI